MKKTYLFYDLETTGLSKPFDQILQFAGIRTDLMLNEIERYELKIRLNPDVIPSPEALITHQISIKTMQEGISEYDAIRQIHTWMNTTGTLSLGYNTLGFDDEFLRFSFYRHLLSPYTHQYAQNCGRLDLYPIAIMFYLFKPHCIHWPIQNKKISFKLEDLNQSNQWVHGKAHHAMTDVEITLALAKAFFKEKNMWHYLCGSFNKMIETKRLHPFFNSQQPALLIHPKIGLQNAFQCPVLFLGHHQHYKNQTLWLRLDTENLIQTTPATIKEQTFVFNKKPAEPHFILKLEARFLNQFSDEKKYLFEKNLNYLQTHPSLFQAIQKWHTEFTYPVFHQADSNARLYLEGFLSREAEQFCEQFHQASSLLKMQLTEKLSHPTLQKLAARLIGRYYPEVLSTKLQPFFNELFLNINATQTTRIDHQGRACLTIPIAKARIQALRNENQLSEMDLNHLLEYEKYLKHRSQI